MPESNPANNSVAARYAERVGSFGWCRLGRFACHPIRTSIEITTAR